MHKRQSIISSIKNSFDNIHIDEAHSFTSAWSLLLKNNYSFALLDMSLPTFDKTNNNTGGTFRVFGGKEIARKITRRKIETPFMFITQYKNFSEDSSLYSFESLKAELIESYPEQCKGFIYYNNASSEWKDEINNTIKDSIYNADFDS
ncbi:hypothetical protein [Aeromonas sp. RU39B]|uniref:hypothetical protein n=1 Tax=Aeromonas sp. RU39B TaxID=1907416 RepID=UPI001C4AE8DB|nr:hypothetical protein [Aeromonas sp. RU39B]